MTTCEFAGVKVERKQACRMRDGALLYADIYRPVDATEALPVLLMRQPYGRAIASTVSHAHPVWYAQQGFIVVIQDVRGTWDSEGEFDPFIHEANDGYDTVEWAAALPGSNGRVGMYGFSYQGSTQWAAASAAPPHLEAIAPAMCASDLYHGMFYPHGRFLLKEHLPWAYQLARDQAGKKGNADDEQRCSASMRHPGELYWQLPLTGQQHPLLEQYLPQYKQWCEHEQYDDFWRQRDWLSMLRNQKSVIPALHIGGWYDVFLMGSFQSFYTLKDLPGGESHRLIVGPWTHIPWGRYAGGYDHGPNADGDIHQEQVKWFNYWLKDEGQLTPAGEAVRYYEFGSKSWRSLDAGHSADRSLWGLQSGAKPANGSSGGGKLCPASKLEIAATKPELFVYDARQPILVNSYEPIDRRGRQDRYEILVYTSEPLEQELHAFGAPKLMVHCELAGEATDLIAMLSIVEADGTARLLSIGRNEISGANEYAEQPLEIELKPFAAHFSSGTRLRLELTGSAFPLFTRHPNKSITPNHAEQLDLKIATLAVYSGHGRQSYLEIPIYN